MRVPSLRYLTRAVTLASDGARFHRIVSAIRAMFPARQTEVVSQRPLLGVSPTCSFHLGLRALPGQARKRCRASTVGPSNSARGLDWVLQVVRSRTHPVLRAACPTAKARDARHIVTNAEVSAVAARSTRVANLPNRQRIMQNWIRQSSLQKPRRGSAHRHALHQHRTLPRSGITSHDASVRAARSRRAGARLARLDEPPRVLPATGQVTSSGSSSRTCS